MEVNPNFSQRALEDFLLVEEAQQHRGSKAFEKLLQRYQEAVFFMMLKMVHNRDDADDLTIEAFGKVFHGIDTYNPKFAFSTWLYKVATNGAIDFMRSNKMEILSINHKTEAQEQDFSANLKDNDPDPEEIFIRMQQTEVMKAILEKLHKKHRTLIELRYYGDLTYEEIAKKTKMPIGTVKTQLYRAKELLYAIMRGKNLK